MPWPQVLVEGQSTLRFAAVSLPPAPAFLDRRKRPASGQSVTPIKKTGGCGLRATHLACLCRLPGRAPSATKALNEVSIIQVANGPTGRDRETASGKIRARPI